MGKRITGIILLLLLLTGSFTTTIYAKTTEAAKPQVYKIDKTYILYRSKTQSENTNYFTTSKLPLTATNVKAKSSDPHVASVRVNRKSSNGRYYEFSIIGQKSGKTELKLSGRVGKRDIEIHIKTVIVNYKNPVASLKIGDRDYSSRFTSGEKTDKDIIRSGTVKISCTPQKGWKINEINKKEVVKENGSIQVTREKIKNNSQMKIEQGEEVKVDIKLYSPSLHKYTTVGVQLTGKIQKPKEQVYDKIIMVGDSRTYRTYHQFGITAPNVRFIAKSGQGYVWMTSTALTKLKKEIADADSDRIAVVFNLGVNDLWNIDFYLEYMNTEVLELSESAGFDLYYMSVNPVSEAKYKKGGYNSRNRNMSQILRFNKQLIRGLDEKYHYIDTYSYMMKYYDVDKMTLPDGLHYTQKASQIIFDLCQAYLAGNSIQLELQTEY